MKGRTGTWLLVLALATVGPVSAQEEPEGPHVAVAGFVAGSLLGGADGSGFADDVVGASMRLTLVRRRALQPWVQLDAFDRPDLECLEGLACNEDGWIARVGATLPLSTDENRPGVQPRVFAGIGAGFSEETEFSYVLGIGAGWLITPRVMPVFEFRWEQLPGIRNIVMLNGGLRIGLF
ncbi:MAG: hypothetical protein GWM90_01855 [Gemmatimonadetes bacterium]|nr:hypothetical protein [Gemmatimonadota bacterium]NIQ52347.1 hypothetical protein [Gemmatimonadota bacterium]NIU72458.1 hypothetical protein [Gammaproteobacteria bacterium]NIX42915.1 hypothetical protein [Gemmatimonadota bacterium]NIY07802.1 hypothetical protein [Gemmatimonadota bacterium]